MLTRAADTLDFTFDPPKIMYGLEVKLGYTWYRIVERKGHNYSIPELYSTIVLRDNRRQEIREMTESEWLEKIRKTFDVSLT